MDYIEAKKLVEKIVKMVESEGSDHHFVTEERKGNLRFIEIKVRLKIE